MAVTRHFSIIMCQASNFYRLDAHMDGAIEGDFFRLIFLGGCTEHFEWGVEIFYNFNGKNIFENFKFFNDFFLSNYSQQRFGCVE